MSAINEKETAVLDAVLGVAERYLGVPTIREAAFDLAERMEEAVDADGTDYHAALRGSLLVALVELSVALAND